MRPQDAARWRARGLDIRTQEPMAAHTTLKVGGPAEIWIEAHSEEDVARALRAAQEDGCPLTVVGGGSNLLVRDGGIPGGVLSIGGGMAQVDAQGTQIMAGAGVRLIQLAQAAQAAGLSGLEAVSGIPGTLGGAVAMNAGCYGVEIGMLVETVTMLDRAGMRHVVAGADMAFGYRQSAALANDWIITGATLRLSQGEQETIAAEMRRYAQMRRDKQPLTLPSAGSFFKRPPGQFAGALIEGAGLKGFAVGGAQVSDKHAGFLVNTGGATAADFLALMAEVIGRVEADSGTTLTPEVRIIGCDSSC